uniref:Uncharacterized protein n=1 Tax=Rangifer tarandus platyrhynchus TaxID=3082113 RepID=A0ACB0FBH6_RANTA|nr:unnamed protein product [Rangifer tarandus platyrhynchus]
MVPTDLTTPEVSMAEKMLFGALVNGTDYSGPGTWLPPGNSRSRDPPASDRARPLMDADRTGQPSQCRQLPKAKG